MRLEITPDAEGKGFVSLGTGPLGAAVSVTVEACDPFGLCAETSFDITIANVAPEHSGYTYGSWPTNFHLLGDDMLFRVSDVHLATAAWKFAAWWAGIVILFTWLAVRSGMTLMLPLLCWTTSQIHAQRGAIEQTELSLRRGDARLLDYSVMRVPAALARAAVAERRRHDRQVVQLAGGVPGIVGDEHSKR